MNQETIRSIVEYDTNGGCWLWTRWLNRDGYGEIKTVAGVNMAHRLSYRAFRGEIPKGMLVCHKCDIPACVNPEHLFLGDTQANSDDMVRKGRSVKWNGRRAGEGNPRAILNNESAAAIRSSTKTVANLAAEYGVSKTTISSVKNGRTWK